MNKEGWKYKKFEDIMSPAKVERCGGRTDLPILSITMHNGIVGQNDRFKKVIASRDKSNYKIVKNGQLVIAFPIDEGLIYTQDVVPIGIMSPAYNIWNVDYSQVDRHFIVRYFHSQYAFSYYKAKLRATTQRRRTMDRSDLLSMPIPVPPLPVQQRIVSELDQLSDIIAMKRKQVEEYDALTQSVFYEMFGDPIVNEKEWPTSTYGDSFSIGSGGTPSKTVKEYWENGTIPWIGSNMCQNTVLYKTDGKFITEEGLNNSSAKILQPGTILVALVGATIGKVALLECETAINQNIAFVKHDDTTDSYFLYYYTMGLYPMFQNVGNGKFKMANQKFVKELPVALPPLPLQYAFAAKVRAIERQKQLVNDSIRELQTLLDSRMQEYFG